MTPTLVALAAVVTALFSLGWSIAMAWQEPRRIDRAWSDGFEAGVRFGREERDLHRALDRIGATVVVSFPVQTPSRRLH